MAKVSTQLGKALEVEQLLNKIIVNKGVYYKNLSFSHHRVINGVAYDMQSSSATITKVVASNDPIKYMMNVRVVNYYIEKSGRNINKNGANVVSLNKILLLDDTFTVRSEYWMPYTPRAVNFNGFEDIRLFNYAGIIYFISSYNDHGKIGIVSSPIGAAGDIPVYRPLWIEPTFKTTNHWEKNWVFFQYDHLKICANKLCVIYKWNPIYICQIDYDTQKLNLVKVNNNVPPIFNKFRGSTNGVVWGDRIWFIVHFHHLIGGIRKYLHCFVVFNLDMELVGYSSPFNFRNQRVEFCVGMIENNDNFIITYSVLDKTTELTVIPIATISALIKAY